MHKKISIEYPSLFCVTLICYHYCHIFMRKLLYRKDKARGLLLQTQLVVYLLICTYVCQCPRCNNAGFCFHGGNQGRSIQEVHVEH